MKVYVGMSGGVDSSLTAALLVEQGHTVTGVYMKNWSQDLPGMKCPWADDLADAKRVAVQLGIDFKVFDFEADYRDKVVGYMIDTYREGRTPNPDIMCNQEVKFKLFLEASLADGADMIATGHYARVVHSDSTPARVARGGVAPSEPNEVSEEGADRATRLEPSDLRGDSKGIGDDGSGVLKTAVDSNKDQTYFLYRVTSSALAKTLFPLGEFTKPQVREMAKERGLYTASKKESMGICFVGQVGIREFLSQYVETTPGAIIDKVSGKQLGMHDGAIFYTIGQRHGLDIGGGLPYYVVGKDMDKNEMYVSTNLQDESLWLKEIKLGAMHWINDSQLPTPNSQLQVRVRHRAPLVPAKLVGDTLRLADAQRAVAAGQSVVIYDGDTCLGGGIVV